MKKFFYLLAASLLSSFLLISCSSGTNETGEVSFSFSKHSLARYTVSREAEPNTEWSIKIKLTAGNETKEQTFKFTDETEDVPQTIKFSDIKVGLQAKAEAFLLCDEDIVASGSSNSITIKSGNNPLTIQLKINGDKAEFTIKQSKKHFKIQTITGTDSTFYSVSGGTIVFSLFDEDGNDVLEGIDWTKDGSQSVWKCSVKIYYGSATGPEEITNYDFDNNEITIYSFLNGSGVYFVTITVSPLSGSYVNSTNQTIEIPDFEPITETIEINVIPSV